MDFTPKNLGHLRNVLGLPQKAVAYDAGMRRPLLSQIETGRVMPTLEEVRRIARAMSRTEEEILEVLKRQGSPLWQKERKVYVRRTAKPAA